MWPWDEESHDELEVLDPLRVERRPPVTDDEAVVLEEICLAATPGPLVPDDRSDGDGTLVCTLPDGTHLVSVQAVRGDLEDARLAAAANAQLISEARSVILRLLRDRQRAKQRERELQERVRQLEAKLAARTKRPDEAWAPRSPR